MTNNKKKVVKLDGTWATGIGPFVDLGLKPGDLPADTDRRPPAGINFACPSCGGSVTVNNPGSWEKDGDGWVFKDTCRRWLRATYEGVWVFKEVDPI